MAVKKLFDPRVSEEQSAEFEREIRILGCAVNSSMCKNGRENPPLDPRVNKWNLPRAWDPRRRK